MPKKYTPKMLSISQILDITQGQLLAGNAPHDTIHTLLLDSRQIAPAAHTLFLAIRGERHDGHQYIGELWARGIRNFLVEVQPDTLSLPREMYAQANIIFVPHTVRALQQIAQHHRQQFAQCRVVGITGSNGKTIVKEWLAQLLATHAAVVKSPKSYNSQIGVPLSMWEMNASHEWAIFEAGISRPNEMVSLRQVIQPHVGIFTNIGAAHDEGFVNRSEKIKEKLQLFTEVSTLIYRRDYQDIHALVQENLPHLHTITWSIQDNRADIQISVDKRFNKYTSISFEYEGIYHKYNVPFQDDASLENIIQVLVFIYTQVKNISNTLIQSSIDTLKNPDMRLTLKKGKQENYIIDDTYNNDLSGLKIAIDFMNHHTMGLEKCIILSDILENNVNNTELYLQVNDLLSVNNINKIIGIGDNFSEYQYILKDVKEKYFFKNVKGFIHSEIYKYLHKSVILVKGARIFQFEQIVHLLEEKTHGTVLEINLEALQHNLNYYRSLLAPSTKLMVMVKAFAYGSGSEVAQLLQHQRVDYLAVAYADEGVALRRNGITLPIMVLNPQPETLEQLQQYRLEPEIYSFHILEQFLAYTRLRDWQDAQIHLKIDTGMRRLGFEPAEIPRLLSVLQQEMPAQMRVASVFTHLAASDEAQHISFSEQQLHIFAECAQAIAQSLGYQPLRHALNSPGIVRFPQAHFDMVRLGIGLYGIEPNDLQQDRLQPIARLKTTISQIKQVCAGETVGYGRSQTMGRDGQIGTIAIGYADGFARRLSNGIGQVWVNGALAPVIGRVCMDMTMIDLTGIEAREGDDVEVFGEKISIRTFASWLETIPYEVLTGISARVRRVFYR